MGREVREGEQKMTRAVLVNFHLYTPYGDQYYEPLLTSFLQSMRRYADEYDKLYLLDSNWNIDLRKIEGMKAEIIRTDPSLRYYDTYKHSLSQIDADLILLMDNDTVVYREGKIAEAFSKLNEFDVASIYDSCGTYTTDKLNGKNKFCPYWFSAPKHLLVNYIDVEWGPNMPEHETLGKLTEVMLADDLKPYEFEEDKSNCLFDGTQDGEKGKDLGYYHIRSGSLPAYLLATKRYGDQATYWKYLNEQPKSEYLRHCAWYQYMGGNPTTIITDSLGAGFDFKDYYQRFIKYHNL